MWLEFIDRLRLWVMCTKGIPLRYVQDQICPGLNANEVQIPCDKHHKVSSLSSLVKSHLNTHNSVNYEVV